MPTKLTLNEQRERAHAWAAFLESNGRQPGNRPEALPSESALYYWMFKNRKADSAGVLAADLRAVLDETSPKWRDPRGPSIPNPDLHARHANDYLAFVVTHGRAPSQLATGRRELSLHHWMTNQRATLAAGKLHPDVRAAITAVIPGWDAPSGNPPRQRGEVTSFAFRMWELEGYLAASGGLLPPSNASGGSQESLGRWLKQQQRQLARGGLKRARKRALDTLAPGWATERRSDQKWSRRVEDLAAFVAEHGRLPRHTRANETERTLQVWLANARKSDLSDDQASALDAAVPSWRGDGAVADSWAARTREIQAWVAQHGHRPRPQSADATESRLGFWITRQRRARKEGRLSPEGDRLLSDALPGWELTDRRQAAPRKTRTPRPHVPRPERVTRVKREKAPKPERVAKPRPITTDDLIERAQRDVTNRYPVLALDDPIEYSHRVVRRYLRLAARLAESDAERSEAQPISRD